MELMNAHYYFREKCYEAAIKECSSNVGDPMIALLKSFCLVLVDRVNEALEAVRPFISHPKSSVAALLMSIYAHNHCQVVDREALRDLDSSLRNAKQNAETTDLFYEGFYHYLARNHGKAQSILDESLTKDPSSSKTLALLGWLQVDAKKQRAALRQFTSALQLDKNNMDALMGEIYSLGPVEALGKVNALVVKQPKAVVPLIEKMKLQLANRQWDNAADTALRTLGLQADNISAQEVRALKFLVFGKYDEVLPILRKLLSDMTKQEPKAYWKTMRVVSAFSRCCGNNSSVLSELENFVKRAMKTGAHSLDVLLEAGHYYFLTGRWLDAENAYKEAAKMDDASLAFCGLTQVGLAQSGLSNEVREQIEFLIDLDEKKENPELLMLRGLLNPAESIELLDKAVSILQSRSTQYKFGIDYLIHLDPELLIKIAHSYPENKMGEKRKLRTLNLVVETCPGLVEANIELAKVQLSVGDFSEATSTLNNILDNIDGSNPHAHLLFANLHIQKNDFEQAAATLEHGLSNNLQIREYPAYHMLSGLVAKHRGNDTLCINSLKQAVTVSKGPNKLTKNELGTLYAELSAAHMRNKELAQAAEDLKEARELLKGTEQEFTVTIATAQLCAMEGSVHKALALLSDIPKNSPNYVKAQIQKADIYLTYLKDGHGFATSYKKLVEHDPSPEHLLLLGDAYMAIQEPELAVQSYEKAMQSNSGNTKLNCKLARVLVKCHQYHKAIKCYKNSGEEGSVELAELLLKLGQPDKAEQVLTEYPSTKKALTLAKVHEKSGDVKKALRVLKDALEETGRSDLEWSAKICQQMAIYSSQLRDHNTAIEHYKRALTYHPGDTSVQIALAKLYMEVNDWNGCELLCKSLMAKDPHNEPALLMVADLALRRVDLASAMNHFTSLLDRRPNYWVALARLVEVSRRSASLQRSLPYLEAAKSIEPNNPGLHYCYGLYHWYNGEMQAAVQSFNGARGDAEWGSQAVHNMVEVCMGQSAANKLLAELKPQNQDEESGLLLLTSFVRVATHDRSEVERAIIDFTTLANNDTHRVGATLGLGMGYMEQGQAARAKAMLKRMAKHPWSLEEADYLERCWLLLGELYIQAGSQQQASDLLHRVITHNQSSAKAYELLGMIAEKEQSYIKAGQHYLQAWNLSGDSNPSLGYKLAYNQLKSKRYSESVATCQRVLSVYPDYPKIKKDILDKALPRLRS
uniref:Tetratricopeptide repeat protein 21B n=1 Tax=Lygus hesperus TaxID=30085 RepID=A0A146LJV1_LYGHE